MKYWIITQEYLHADGLFVKIYQKVATDRFALALRLYDDRFDHFTLRRVLQLPINQFPSHDYCDVVPRDRLHHFGVNLEHARFKFIERRI